MRGIRYNILLFFAFFTLCSAIEPQVHETVYVDIVEVFVSVLDSNELPVVDLTIDDFFLKVDGKKEAITHFSRILDPDSEVPLTIVFLVDTSGSMKVGEEKARRIDLAKSFALSVMKDIKPTDQVQVMTFDVVLNVLTPMTSNESTIDQALAQVELDPAKNPGTALLGALQFVPGLIEKQSGRKLIILLSDGHESFTSIKPYDVVELLNKHGITILVLGTTDINYTDRLKYTVDAPATGPALAPTVVATTEIQKAKRLLRNLAEKTGGRAYFPIDSGQVSRTINKFRHITRSQYMLGFQPKVHSKSESKIEVKCMRKGLKLLYRKSYTE